MFHGAWVRIKFEKTRSLSFAFCPFRVPVRRVCKLHAVDRSRSLVVAQSSELSSLVGGVQCSMFNEGCLSNNGDPHISKYLISVSLFCTSVL